MHAGPVDGPDAHHMQRGFSQRITHHIEARVLLLLDRIRLDLPHPGHVVVQQRVHGAAGLAHRAPAAADRLMDGDMGELSRDNSRVIACRAHDWQQHFGYCGIAHEALLVGVGDLVLARGPWN